jgi:hypothetical protein
MYAAIIRNDDIAGPPNSWCGRYAVKNSMNILRPEVLGVYPTLLSKVVGILRNLENEAWEYKTLLPTWRIKDIVAHLVSGALRKLSSIENATPTPHRQILDYKGLVAAINRENEQWVETIRNLHPNVLIDLLESSYGKLIEKFQEMNPEATAIHSVGWAGESVSANWFDIAREYTELWHHQAQICDKIEDPTVLDDSFFRPFIETCFQALSHHYQKLDISASYVIAIEIPEMEDGVYFFSRESERWHLKKYGQKDSMPKSDARISADKDDLWKVFTNTVDYGSLADNVSIEGEETLAFHLLSMTCIMA